MQPFEVVKSTLSLERNTVALLLLLTICVSMLSLVIPVGVQTIVNTLTFSIYTQPIFILTAIILAILFLAGAVRLCQMIIVENTQQEIFVRFALLIARHLPRLKLNLQQKHRGPELINRFFEVVPIQKTLPVLMVYLVEIFVQAVTGLILLALYHPYLLILDILLLISINLAIALPFKKAMHSAFDESDHKHHVAAWLEEHVHCPILAKFGRHREFALTKVDDHLVHYLSARRRHFRSILKHFFGFYGIYMFFNAGLLGIGGWLVIKQQLSLGQLVASELVLNTVISSFLKLGYYLKDLYDLIASAKKISSVFDLDYEPDLQALNYHPAWDNESPYKLSFEHICYKDGGGHQILDNVSFQVASREIVAITDKERIGKHELFDVLIGITEQASGTVKINGHPMRINDKLTMRKHTCIVTEIELLPGTIIENIHLNKSKFSIEAIYYLLERLDIKDPIEKLPEGLNSQLLGHRLYFSYNELFKLCLCRAIVSEPKLLIIGKMIDAFPKHEIKNIVGLIKQLEKRPTTLFNVGYHVDLSLFPRVIRL